MNILVTGPESTGKSTISQFIADEFGATLIPEYARIYLEEHGPDYNQQDLLHIAKHHYASYKEASASKLIVLDSFLLNIKIWSEYKYGSCDPWILDKYNENAFDLVFLCTPEVGWVDDPLRENPNNRNELLDIFKSELKTIQQEYVVLESDRKRREEQVKLVIQEFGLRESEA